MYNWSIKDIENKLKFIEKLLETEIDEVKKEILEYDSVILMNYIDDFYIGEGRDEIGKLLDNYIYAKDELTPIKFIWSDIKRFYQIVDKHIEIPNLNFRPLTKEKLLELTHDFYKTLDPFFYKHFLEVFNKKDDHIRFQKNNKKLGYTGETIMIPSLNESYIDIFLNSVNFTNKFSKKRKK